MNQSRNATEYYAKSLYVGQTASLYDDKRKTGFLNNLRWKSEMKVVRKVLNSLAKRQRVLDVPCGTGRFIPLFLRAEHQVVSVDVSADMLKQVPAEYCWEPGRVSLQVGDAQQLDFEDNSFDYVFSMRFFNHLPPLVRIEVLRELARVARKRVVIEVRFAGPLGSGEVRSYDAVKDIAKVALWNAKGVLGRCGNTSRPSTRKRMPRPGFAEFQQVAASVGLRLAECHRIFWGPTLCPMRLCVLARVK